MLGMGRWAGYMLETCEGARQRWLLFSLIQEVGLAWEVGFCSSLGALGYPGVLQAAKPFF